MLVVHNAYKAATPSGENEVVHDDVEQMRAAGISVRRPRARATEIEGAGFLQRADAALGPTYSFSGTRAFRRVIAQWRPNLVHVHNVNPWFSPSLIRISKQNGIPVVATMHNFRVDCVSGQYFRSGAVCTDCSNLRVALPAVKHACYRGSHIQSGSMALGRSVHRGSWLSVDAWLALTPFHADTLCNWGVSRDRIYLRPTAVGDPGNRTPLGERLSFIGRLEEAKGVDLLLAAWAHGQASGRELVIAGDGPLRESVKAAERRLTGLTYLGNLPHSDVQRVIEGSAAVLIPSKWFEGFPRVLAEAFALGRPVMASNVGGLATVVDESSGGSWMQQSMRGQLSF